MRRIWPALLLLALLVISLTWQPWDAAQVNLAIRHGPPSWAHPLGTDHLGRDLLSRLLGGFAGTAQVLAIVIALAAGAGTLAGAAAALLGGTAEMLLLRAAELTLAIPGLVVALTVTALFGLTPLVAGLALAAVGWAPYATLAHGLTARLMVQDYMRAAEALGVGRSRRLHRHLLPNIAGGVRAYLGSDAGKHLLTYASLSFLGLGADTSRPDWGAQLFEYRLFLFDNPLLMLWPTLAIVGSAALLNAMAERPDGSLERSSRWT